MAELKDKEMFKHVDYDADRIETYLIFQNAFIREDKRDLVEKLKFVSLG